MSHQGITAGDHQDGVYHDSHALEGGSENVSGSLKGWAVDRNNNKIVVVTYTNTQLWDLNGAGYIKEIFPDTINPLAVYANTPNLRFFYLDGALPNQTKIYDYDGVLLDEFSENWRIGINGLLDRGYQTTVDMPPIPNPVPGASSLYSILHTRNDQYRASLDDTGAETLTATALGYSEYAQWPVGSMLVHLINQDLRQFSATAFPYQTGARIQKSTKSGFFSDSVVYFMIQDASGDVSFVNDQKENLFPFDFNSSAVLLREQDALWSHRFLSTLLKVPYTKPIGDATGTVGSNVAYRGVEPGKIYGSDAYTGMTRTRSTNYWLAIYGDSGKDLGYTPAPSSAVQPNSFCFIGGYVYLDERDTVTGHDLIVRISLSDLTKETIVELVP